MMISKDHISILIISLFILNNFMNFEESGLASSKDLLTLSLRYFAQCAVRPHFTLHDAFELIRLTEIWQIIQQLIEIQG